MFKVINKDTRTTPLASKLLEIYFTCMNFDRVPREVICFALTQRGVPEYFKNGVMSLYNGCKTAVSVDGGPIKFIFCESCCRSSVCFESTFIYHGNGCFDGRYEGWFIDGIVVCKRSCFVWEIIKWGYGKVWEIEKCSGRKGSEGEFR